MKKIILLILFIFTISCGYQPIFNAQKLNFSINKIEYEKNKLNRVIAKELTTYQNKKNVEQKYDLKIFSYENKKVTLKDKKGDPSNLRLSLSTEIKVFDNQKLIFEKKYDESFEYQNSSKKFELRKYEDKIRQSMLGQISSQIINDLYSIK
tara:strand:- start:1019 stop:1471 length:453 start_codon:yes stop_codon:yes gene_type:complete